MSDFRDLIAQLATASRPLTVLRELEQLMMQTGSTSDYLAADGLLQSVDLGGIPLKPLRVYFIRSFTLEQLVPVLRVRSLLAGMKLNIGMGPYGQWQQEILDAESGLYKFGPDIVVVVVRLEDVAPALSSHYAVPDSQSAVAVMDEVVAIFEALLTRLRQRTKATILVHNFEAPGIPPDGIFDHHNVSGQVKAIHDVNYSLAQMCREIPDVYVFDYEGLTSRYGKVNWLDPRMWHIARMAVNPLYIHHLADEYVRYIVNIAGLTRKCLVLDLDGTLWGGIVGDDGIDGIHLGPTYPGSAFMDFQAAILDLRRRGIIIGVCSKNDPRIALEAIDNHPHMLLRQEQIASMRINWDDKASNIREIAKELNIGVDSIVFLDDNPAEVGLVRMALPEVLAYQVPAQPEKLVGFLRSLPVFDLLTITSEDRGRGEEYRQQAARRALETQSASLEDFYRQLAMKAQFRQANESTLPRIAQLTQKTNQFNLTTRRYTEQDLRDRMTSGEFRVYSMNLEDCFGDNGLVAVGIIRPEGSDAWIDTLLMSCRVMGRTAEQSFVHHLAVQARNLGCTRLMAEYIPTRKNGVVSELYPSLGFVPAECSGPAEQETAVTASPGSSGDSPGDGLRVWYLDLVDLKLSPSAYVSVTSEP